MKAAVSVVVDVFLCLDQNLAKHWNCLLMVGYALVACITGSKNWMEKNCLNKRVSSTEVNNRSI